MITTAALVGDLLATYAGRSRRRSNAWLPPAQQLCFRSRAVLHANDKVSQELFTEVSAKNAVFKKRYDSTTLSQRPVRMASNLRDDVARQQDPAGEPDLMRTRSPSGLRRSSGLQALERRTSPHRPLTGAQLFGKWMLPAMACNGVS
jgi:hypothetical protein